MIASRENKQTAETALCLPLTALKKVPYVVQWYLTVALRRETNLSQKADKRSGYGIFRYKKLWGYGIFGWDKGGGGGGGLELRRYGIVFTVGTHYVRVVVQ